MIYIRYSLLLVLAIFVGFFSNCSNKPSTEISIFGELDSSLIAADTAMEINMDLSYEYHKTLVENDSTVFDFLAYDKPIRQTSTQWESKFIVIKRTRTNQDTIIKDRREGHVKGLNLVDLDHDGQPEIVFYEDQTTTKNQWLLRIFKRKPDDTYGEIILRELDAKSPQGHYKGNDTFFVYRDHLIRRFPYYEKYDDTTSKDTVWQSYGLNGGKISLENEKKGNDFNVIF